MDPIPFHEHVTVRGKKVRDVREPERIGEVVYMPRLPWVDEQRKAYTTLAVVFPDAPMVRDETGFRKQITYLGVQNLEFADV